MAALKLFGRTTGADATGRAKRGPPAVFEAAPGVPPAAATARLRAVRKLPGCNPARRMLGEALALEATATLIERAGESTSVKHRVDDAWQPADPLSRDVGADVIAVVKAVAAAQTGTSKGVVEGECVVRVGGTRRPCRVTVRGMPQGEQALLVFGGELAAPEAALSGAGFSRLFARLLRRDAPAPPPGPPLPAVTLAAAAGSDAEKAKARLDQAQAAAAYQQACDLVVAAIAARATDMLIECAPKEVAAHGDVDGVWRPLQTLDRTVGDGVAAVLKTVAGLDPRDRRTTQAGQLQTVIDGKPWPCRVLARGAATGERLQLSFDYGRPKIKSLADAGMSTAAAASITALMGLQSGLIVLATPKRGGLSTLFECVIQAADRMLREFVVIEDVRSPRPEIQNVKPIRWDAAKQLPPAAAVDLALREYPGALVTCDLHDADLAKKLIEQAEEGKLVVLGIRGDDAADGIAKLRSLGVDAAVLGRVLLAAVGGRLVRKLCPKCHEEYLPSLERMAKLKLDPAAVPSLRRAHQGGCPVCTGTGFLGRTGIFEIAAGRTLNAYVAKGADAKVLRQAAVKDGMRSLQHDAFRKVADGMTSIDEIQRVFAKG
jgi:type II secretory ATPase GspE/PulE/Tfp pilus assembly ATPase PilB-like protein